MNGCVCNRSTQQNNNQRLLELNKNSLILWKAKQACIKQNKGLACGLYVEHQRRNLKHGTRVTQYQRNFLRIVSQSYRIESYEMKQQKSDYIDLMH